MENLGINKKIESFWQNRPILVTGGAGFIGSNLVKKLLSLGSKIVVLDLKSFPPISDHLEKKPIFVQGDACQLNLLEKLIKDYKISLIFHLAAQPIVETAYFDPQKTLENNIVSTINVLEAARAAGGVDGVIITSSDKAYGKACKLPYKENQPLKGDHPYDVSKSSSDLIAQAYFRTYNLPVVISRFSNVFGPGDLNLSRLMPGIFKAIINKKEFLIRSDGKPVREYTYVGDIVSGYVKLAENIKNLRGEAFNFGSKNILSVIEAIKKVEGILNVKVDYQISNRAKNEIPEQYLDWTKAKKILNWQPKTSFEEGIKESFNWYEHYFNRKTA